METSLHQQLKGLYATDKSKTEVVFKGFRIDAISDDGELIEIQHASLGALRDKTRELLAPRSRNRLRIVKPIIRRKKLTTVCPNTGEVLRSRMSPKSCDWLDIFMDLVHFSNVFPHKRLKLEILLVDCEEIRIDRQAKRRRGKNYKSMDISLLEVGPSIELCNLADLLSRLPIDQLPNPFSTSHIAEALEKPRWFAQKVAYCLRQMKAIELVGKQGNSVLYKLAPQFVTTLARRFTSTSSMKAAN
ncbi:MAG: hypothetical protein U0930_17810 [Pirellulales bacterium]